MAEEFVYEGQEVAIVPRFAVDAHKELRAVTISEHSLQWSLHVATLRKRRPTALIRALLDLIDAHLLIREGILPGRG
jgi:DNA-binding transcriptional LysR family regulator